MSDQMLDLRRALAWYDREGQRLMDWEPVVAAARAVLDGQEIWWCTQHQSPYWASKSCCEERWNGARTNCHAFRRLLVEAPE